MNYYILGIAIILIILMMGTKKREGYTLAGLKKVCPEGGRITDLDECKKAALELYAQGVIKHPPAGWSTRPAVGQTAQGGGWVYNMKAGDSSVPHQWDGRNQIPNYDKGCWISETGHHNAGFLYFNIMPQSQDKHISPYYRNICGKGRDTEGELITTPASSWDQAEAYCKQQGRNLVSIHSDAENDKVIKYMKENTTSSYPWLGGKTTSGNKSKNLNDYKWTDGTQFDYKASTWHTNDNAPTHVHMYRDGAWGTWTGTSEGICGPKGGWKKPEKGCKSMDGRYSMGDGRRYTGGWALSNGEGDRTKCKALCESQPECKITGQYCNSTAYPSDNRCYCQFGDGCKKDEEGEVKCRFTVDNVVDEVKYNGKKINYTGNSKVWSEAKEFSFTPVPGGVLEIKGHESSGVAGCKNSGLQLECESSKHPKWNHWGSNEKDWKTGDGRPVCISTSGFYLPGAKGYGKKIWDSNNNVENKWGAVTLVGSPDGVAGYEKAGDNFCVNDAQTDLLQTKWTAGQESRSACGRECDNQGECSGFEWYDSGWNGSKCHLMLNKDGKGAATTYKRGDRWQDAQCYIKPKHLQGEGTEKGPCKEDDDYDHGGADIAGSPYSNIETSSACCDKCKENPDCKSWTWGKVGGSWSKKCWIKNKKFGSSGQRTRKAGLISGQSPPRPPPIPAPKSGRVANPDCVKYNWSDWSPCNRMCAGGTQTRIRTNNGFCIEGGKVRYFDSEKRACNTQECPRGPTGQQGQLGLQGPRGPKGQKGPTGKSGGGTGFPGKSGVVGGEGSKGNSGATGPKGERGFRGEEGKVMSRAQVNNDLLSGIYEQLLKVGGVSQESFSKLEPFNNPNYN